MELYDEDSYFDLSSNVLRLSSDNIDEILDQKSFKNHIDILILEGCAEHPGINGLSLLHQIKNLKIIQDKAASLPDWVFTLKKLSCLEISHTSISVLPEEIRQLKHLEQLTIESSPLCELPNALSHLVSLEKLSISDCPLSSLPSQLNGLQNLVYLDLRHTKITSFPEAMGNLSLLSTLHLSAHELQLAAPILKLFQALVDLTVIDAPEELPEEVYDLANLRSLYIHGKQFRRLSEKIDRLSSLAELSVSQTSLEILPMQVCRLKRLKYLYLWETNLQALPEQLGELQELESFSILRTKIKKLPKSFEMLSNLRDCLIGQTQITEVPNCFQSMKNISDITLNSLVLDYIPESVVQTGLPFQLGDEESAYTEPDNAVNLTNVCLKKMPLSLFEQPRELIEAYYKEPKIAINEMKVVFLGDGEVGKSYIIQRILHDGKKSGYLTETTPGIDINSYCFHTETCDLNIQFWDFGGQEIMHSMHRCFLTSRTLYVIVLNARDDTQNDRIYYWMRNIESFAPQSPVIAVINKMDLNPNASINEYDLKKKYSNLKDLIKLSAKEDSDDSFHVLLGTIRKQILELDGYGLTFPASWAALKSDLEQMNSYHITDDEYKSLCQKHGIDNEDIQIWLLDWFNDMGVSFSYHKDKNHDILEEYKVLKPQWITNAIYIIIFSGKNYSSRGMIEEAKIKELLKNPPQSVFPITYKPNEIRYILEVMRKFELSFKLEHDESTMEFIPSLCDRNQPAVIDSELKEDTLKYKLSYEYLPNNVIHKLMIQMHDDLDFQKVWLTGAHFVNEDTGCSAVVKMDENDLVIWVNSNNPQYESWQYLACIRGALSRINQKLNLKAKDYIIFQEFGAEDQFLYDDIIILLEDGISSQYSTKLRKNLTVAEIIRKVEGSAGADRMQKCIDETGEAISKNMNINTINFNGSVGTVINGDMNDKIQNNFNSSQPGGPELREPTKQEIDHILEELKKSTAQDLAPVIEELINNRNDPKTFGKKLKSFLSGTANAATIGTACAGLLQYLSQIGLI